MAWLICVLIIGVGATAVMDLWGVARKPLLGIPAPDYALVGRWIAWMTRGRFGHDSIARSSAVRGELLIGWLVHYGVGIAFAAVLVGIEGLSWVSQPTLVPALLVGIGSVAAPFLLMQPGMGAGIAASRTPNPSAARRQSLATHAIFGFGLYLAGHVARLLLAATA